MKIVVSDIDDEIMLQNVAKVKPKAAIDRNKPFLFRVVIYSDCHY